MDAEFKHSVHSESLSVVALYQRAPAYLDSDHLLVYFRDANLVALLLLLLHEFSEAFKPALVGLSVHQLVEDGASEDSVLASWNPPQHLFQLKLDRVDGEVLRLNADD